ncbi:hypothetical protein LTR10_014538 [Elasticomyces elasticus]|uniref:Lanthionine synthetase C-like protein n=1 Tax=Exophiala sideris TaxID=1016849 RepID=A0ABR0JT70_9EURO|nr:hypothetical protein LTR10_014538 [Elasticomyces elasticus]KAK5040517.1 hypothetical protein LTS07_001015 [Exophiala sideris]KAK5068895.1 hypothetical protein LTR69_001016 [Exophiala sideris]KAK5186491.1 hypothetical protein LTR44_001547 [Eurotiomycetes sp. CCFEE 6388]
MGGRHFKNDKAPSRQVNSGEELVASLTRINTYNPPVQTCSTGWTFHGLYYGPTSIAYLFLRLSQYYPDLIFKGQSLLDWAQAYLDLGATQLQKSVDSDHCGIANDVLAQLAIRAVMQKDPSLVQQLCSYESTINDEGGSDEWLYGRSGYLYFLRLARSGFEEGSNVNRLVTSTIQKTVQRILTSRQPWTWHGKAYLGAAHGAFGIICQIVLSLPSASKSVEHILTEILDTQFPSGNFPSSLPPGSDRLVQFCHGGPGAVLSLRVIRPHFPNLQSKIDSAIEIAQKDTWERGVLTKEPCLCHGIAGNALTLDHSAEFQHFISYMSSNYLEAQGWMNEAGRSDEFVGLYTGEAGRAWAWAVADKPEELGRACIGFNDL